MMSNWGRGLAVAWPWPCHGLAVRPATGQTDAGVQLWDPLHAQSLKSQVCTVGESRACKDPPGGASESPVENSVNFGPQ